MKFFERLEYISLNIVGGSVTAWLSAFSSTSNQFIAVLVGLSILIMNGVKIYGIHLDNKIKNKNLNE